MKLIGINNCNNVVISYTTENEEYDKNLQNLKSNYNIVFKLHDDNTYDLIKGENIELIEDFISKHNFSIDKFQFF